MDIRISAVLQYLEPPNKVVTKIFDVNRSVG